MIRRSSRELRSPRRRRCRLRLPRRLGDRAGLSLVELVVAMMVLTIGLLGMAAGTGLMIRTVDLAKLETNRSAAMQSGIDQIRATPWEDMESGQQTYGDYTVSWTIEADHGSYRHMRFEITGPGRIPGLAGNLPAVSSAATTTFDYQVDRR